MCYSTLPRPRKKIFWSFNNEYRCSNCNGFSVRLGCHVKRTKMLDQFGVKAESRVLSAHRTPKELEEFIRECEDQKVKAFIAGAGLSAALPGVVAALTTTPVIGVPLNAGSLDGMDALMSIVQMPPGIPVGTVAIGKPGAINAALYAVAMMAVNDSDLSEKLKNYRKEQAEKVLAADLS